MDRVRQWYGRVPTGLLVRLLVLPVALSIVDFSVTLFFQPQAYWEGDRSVVLEANPIAKVVLLLHPMLMIPAMTAWYVLIFPLIFKTRARIGLRVVVFHILAHLIAISGWLVRMREEGWWLATLLFGVVAVLSWKVLGPFRNQWNASEPVRRLHPGDTPAR